MPQPVDPETDPHRIHATDWVPIGEVDKLDSHQYVRFRVEFALPEGYVEGVPLPVLRRLHLPANHLPD